MVGKEYAFGCEEITLATRHYEVVFEEFLSLQKEVAYGFLWEVFHYMAYAYALLYSCGTEDVFVVDVLWAKGFLFKYGLALVDFLYIEALVGYVPASFA